MKMRFVEVESKCENGHTTKTHWPGDFSDCLVVVCNGCSNERAIETYGFMAVEVSKFEKHLGRELQREEVIAYFESNLEKCECGGTFLFRGVGTIQKCLGCSSMISPGLDFVKYQRNTGADHTQAFALIWEKPELKWKP